MLVYECIHGLALAYLADALPPVTGLPMFIIDLGTGRTTDHGSLRSTTEHSASL